MPASIKLERMKENGAGNNDESWKRQKCERAGRGYCRERNRRELLLFFIYEKVVMRHALSNGRADAFYLMKSL